MSNLIKVETLGGEHVEVKEELINLSSHLKTRTKENPIKLDLSSNVFKKVVEFLNLLKEHGPITIPEPLPEKSDFHDIFTNKAYPVFIDSLEFEMVFELINAGALLELELLHDLACSKIAFFMKGKSPEEVNNHFTIECQLTNDEAKELGLEVEEDETQNN